jgi:hypothetical protein
VRRLRTSGDYSWVAVSRIGTSSIMGKILFLGGNHRVTEVLGFMKVQKFHFGNETSIEWFYRVDSASKQKR